MKRFLFYIIMVLISNAMFANQSLSNVADSLYAQSEYHSAIKIYEKVLSDEGASSKLYYNLANAYYRTENIGKAILNYERALRFDVNNEDARYNLQYVKTKIADNIPDNRNFITRVCDAIVYALNSNTWAYMSIVLLLLLISLVSCYIFSNKIIIRKIGFFGGSVVLLIFIITITCSIISARYRESKDEAIVIDASTMLSTKPQTPQSHAEEALLLHEGAKVILLDSVYAPNDDECRMWYEIEINNNRAWIKSTSVERI